MQQQQDPNRLQKGAKHVLSVVTDTILGKIVTVAIAAAVAGVGGTLAVQKNQKAADRTSRSAVSENGRYGSSDQINGAAGPSDQSRQESSSAYVRSDSSESKSVSSRSETSSREETQSDSDRQGDSSSSDTSSSSSSSTASSESDSQPADSQ